MGNGGMLYVVIDNGIRCARPMKVGSGVIIGDRGYVPVSRLTVRKLVAIGCYYDHEVRAGIAIPGREGIFQMIGRGRDVIVVR
jgi:hypothetical protein